jgi:co-chaperonin GroES (HSP10)
MTIRAVNNTIIVRPNYEVLRRLSNIALAEDQTIETKEFGTVKVGGKTYDNQDHNKEMAWGEVVSIGRGAAWMRDEYRLDKVLKPGDIIGFESCQQVSTKFQGEEVYFLPLNAALCRFNPQDERPKPLGVYVLTVEEPGAGERFTFMAKNRGFELPKTQLGSVIKVCDAPHSQVKYCVQRLVDVGDGGMALSEKFKECVPIHPERAAIGGLALFLHTLSVKMRFQEQSYLFTSWERVRAVAEL